MNYIFDHDQEHNGYFDVLSPDENSDCQNIEDAFVNPLDKYEIKFNDIKLPSKEILNYEDDNHDFYKSFDYENTPEDVVSREVDIESLSLFAQENSGVYPVLAMDHESSKDAYQLCKNPTTKETSNDSGEVDNPTIMLNGKTNETHSDLLPKEIINQSKKVDKFFKKTKKARSSNKESSTKIKRLRKFGYSRWGRKEDCQMFCVLRQLCNQESVDIEDFWTDHAKISTQHDCILLNLVSQMNWRGDTQSLFKRIQSQGRDQKLSVRQIKMLKRLNTKAIEEKKVFSLEDVADSFPGKSISALQSALENILTDIKN